VTIRVEALPASNAAGTEYLIFLRHSPSGDGLLLGVLENRDAAEAIAAALRLALTPP
jgi:hypothetical protein